MNCCDDYEMCNQGRDCPVRTYKTEGTFVLTYIVKFLAIIGFYTFIMFVAGYLWASAPLTVERSCTPDLVDKIFK
jgi:hypothetical protein